MNNTALFLFLICILFSCKKEQDEPEMLNDQEFFLFQDDFETETDDLDELFPADLSRWTNIQIVNTESGDN